MLTELTQRRNEMKKLLVLVMILGLSVTANGAWLGLSADGTTTPDPDGEAVIMQNSTAVVSVIVGAGSGVTGYLDLAKGKATMDWTSNAVPQDIVKVMPAGGDLGGVFQDYSTGSLYDYFIGAQSSTGNYPGGIAIDATVHATGAVGDSFTVLLLDPDTFAEIDALRFTIITPEPITIGLLGLGGLFLRRRK
jgi:hypothetical protein